MGPAGQAHVPGPFNSGPLSNTLFLPLCSALLPTTAATATSRRRPTAGKDEGTSTSSCYSPCRHARPALSSVRWKQAAPTRSALVCSARALPCRCLRLFPPPPARFLPPLRPSSIDYHGHQPINHSATYRVHARTLVCFSGIAAVSVSLGASPEIK